MDLMIPFLALAVHDIIVYYIIRLGEHLDRALKEELPPIVRLVRTPSRSGLIRARLFGANAARGAFQ
jgi:hypothetical protein